MFSKLIIAALISVAVAAPQHQSASQFPAGVDPSKCPGFPICDNALLHGQAQPQSQPQASNSWNAPAPSWNDRQEQGRSQWEQPRSQWEQPKQQQQWNPQPQQQWNRQPEQQWNQQPQQQWNRQPSQPQPQWNQPQPSSAPSNHHASTNEIFGAGGDKYPAGVNPQSCPNYPYCEGAGSYDSAPAAPPTSAPPLPGYNERQYPAGVSAQSCPNFPYCN